LSQVDDRYGRVDASGERALARDHGVALAFRSATRQQSGAPDARVDVRGSVGSGLRATQVITISVKKSRPHTRCGLLSVTLMGAEMCLPFTQSGWQVLTVPVPVPIACVLDHVQVIDSRKKDESPDTPTLFGSNTGDAADHPLAAR